MIKNKLSITTKYTVAVDSLNSSFKLNFNGIGPIIDQKLIELNNEFLDPIEINTSAQIRVHSNCSCEKIIINSPNNPKIYFIGDISKIKTIEINSPCSLFAPYSQIFSTPNCPEIKLNLTSPRNTDKISLNGNLSQSNLNIGSYCNIYLNGILNLVTSISMLNPIPLILSLNSNIKNIDLQSNLLITATKALFDKLKDPIQTPGIGHDKLILNKTSYNTSIINGQGILNIKIDTPGVYSITAALHLDEDDIIIGSKDITII